MIELAKFNVLLVEDSQDDVFFTRSALEESGYCHVLHVVTDGESALDFLKKSRRFACAPTPDVIFLDLNIPKVPGKEVFRFIQADQNLRRIPICFMVTSPGWVDFFQNDDLSNVYRLEKSLTAEKIVNTLDPLFRR